MNCEDTSSGVENLILPLRIINQALEEVLNEYFDINFNQRLVRQNRTHNVGTLPHIDYTFPCYELSSNRSKNPVDIAKVVAGACEKIIKKDDERAKIKIEAISGYVNFYLTNEFVVSTLRSFCDVTNPGLLIMKDKLLKLIVMYEGFEYEDLRNLSDSLEILNSVKTNLNANLYFDLFSLKNDTLNSPEDNEHQQIKKTKPENLLLSFKKWGDIRVNYSKNSSAIYLTSTKESLPLRSINGKLFPLYYYLLFISSQLNSLQANKSVIFTPQKYHSILNSLLKINNVDKIILFDPRVAKADIQNIISEPYVSIDYFIKKIFGAYLDKSCQGTVSRIELLFLLDFYIEMEDNINNGYIPQIFDQINNVLRLTNNLALR